MADDFCHIFQCKRLHINFICNGRVCHYSRRIGIAQDYFIPLFFQRKTCLCSRIIKFRCLSDYNRTRTNNQYFLYISSLCHVCFPPFRIDTESPGGKTTPHQFNPVPWAGNAPGQGPHEKSLKRPAFTCVCFPQILAFLAYKVKYETYNIFPIFVKTFSFIAPS